MSTYSTPPAPQDKSSIGFGILGFLIPLVGLILWLVWKAQTPLKAKSCGIGALIGVIVYVIFYIIMFAIAGSTLSQLQ